MRAFVVQVFTDAHQKDSVDESAQIYAVSLFMYQGTYSKYSTQYQIDRDKALKVVQL